MLKVTAPHSRITERRYTLDWVLRERLGLDYQLVVEERCDTAITMSAGEAKVMVPDIFLASPDWLRTSSIPDGNLVRVPLRRAPFNIQVPEPDLPILFPDMGVEQLFIEELPDRIAIRFDLFGSVFFLLTRYEEAVRPDCDHHGRFPASASLLGRSRLLARPVVDEYIEVLWSCLHRLWPRLTRHRSSYRLNLTHDVDHPFAAVGHSWADVARNAVGDLLIRHEPGLAWRRLLARRVQDAERERDPNDTFDLLMEVSESHGCQSAFYFMTGDGKTVFDGKYDLGMPHVRSLMKRIARRDHEIGFHPSYDTLGRRDLLEAEFDHLRAEAPAVKMGIWGGRQHYLRWRAPQSWLDWESVGLSYDSSVGFAELPGFRCGTCFEFPVFDVYEGRMLTLRERPLIAMDVTLFRGGYLNGRGLVACPEVLIDLKRRVRHYGGLFTLLWHNSSILTRGQQLLYRNVVRACA